MQFVSIKTEMQQLILMLEREPASMPDAEVVDDTVPNCESLPPQGIYRAKFLVAKGSAP